MQNDKMHLTLLNIKHVFRDREVIKKEISRIYRSFLI